MAFRLFKIPLRLWTICFVSVYNEDEKIFQALTFDFSSKNFWKREQFSIVLKENNGDPSVIEWRILHICKTDVAQTFGSCRSWLVITLSAIAYNVNNNLDEVLLAIVCTVYSGNIITRSRLFGRMENQEIRNRNRNRRNKWMLQVGKHD